MFSEGIENFLNFLRETEQLYRIAVMEEQEANDETQDILHSLELTEMDYHEKAKTAQRLKEVRQKRRSAKDTVNKSRPIVEWTGSNQQVAKALERLLGDVRRAEKNTKNRIYTPKTTIRQDAGKGGTAHG